jgi:hypothetical protein
MARNEQSTVSSDRHRQTPIPTDRSGEDCPPPSTVPLPSLPRSDALETLRNAEDQVYRYTGLRLENLQMLEIGSQQDQRHLRRLGERE